MIYIYIYTYKLLYYSNTHIYIPRYLYTYLIITYGDHLFDVLANIIIKKKIFKYL